MSEQAQPVIDTSGMALALPDDDPVVAQIQAVSAQMRLQWEKEKADLLKFKSEDIRHRTRMQIAAMVAGNMIGEGAMGARLRADQIACQAVEIADAVIVELESRPIPPEPKRPG